MSLSRLSSDPNSQTIPPQWKCKPVLSSQELNWPNIQFDYYHHPPYVLPQHCHSKHLLKIFLSGGKVERCLGNERHIGNVSPGDVAIIPADVVHCASWQGKIEFILLSIEPNFIVDLARTTTYGGSVVKILPQFATRDSLIYSISSAIKTQLECDRHYCYSYACILFNAIAIHVLKKYSESSFCPSNFNNNSPIKHRLQIALDYIEQNLGEKLTLDLLAERVNINKYYLCRLFTKYLNITPHQYIIKQRIAKAEQLLKQEPSMQIVDIALRCGFASHSHFVRQFNQNAGMNPKTYRTSNGFG